MAIQHRRGVFTKFDPTKLLPGEWAIVLSGDTSASDGRAAYICFAAGIVKRIATFEDMAENIANANEQLIEQLTQDVGEATDNANSAAQRCEGGEDARVAAEKVRVSNENARISAESIRVSNENARVSAESARASSESARSSAEDARASAEATRMSNEQARVEAETLRAGAETTRISNEDARESAEQERIANERGRVTAEEGRVAAETARVSAEADRVIEFADMQQRARGWLKYYCAEGEYDPDTLKPTVSSPDNGTLYYVPEANPTTDDQWIEWEWDAPNSRWERHGVTEASIAPMTADQMTAIMDDDQTVTSTNVVNASVWSGIWAKLKTKFSALSHEHSASDVTSGTLGVARGGTGSSTHAANSVLVGNGTTALKHVASSAGALYSTGANAEPKFGTLPVAQGGTGAATAEAARENLGIDLATVDGKLCAVYVEGD